VKTLLRHISLGLIVTFLGAGYSQNLSLTSIGMSPANSVRLKWNWGTSKPSDNYSYTLFQWDNALSIWQTTSTKCNDTIRVLNVYPDIAVSNTLANWMHDPTIGFGKILVTPVSITNFNNNPDSYLKNGSGEYKYDVIMFGSCDVNNGLDLNPASSTAVRNFLTAGRGVLFGHDTQTSHNAPYFPPSSGGKPNFNSLKDKTNLDIDQSDDIWRCGQK